MAAIKYHVGDALPCYVNNARIEATDENVFLDFGVADPFEQADASVTASTARARLVMNKSTFMAFAEHIQKMREQLEKDQSSALPITIMSRCPPSIDPGG